MYKLSRSEHQNFKKQQHRAAGIMDALYNLAGLDPASWPEGRVIETGAYQSAKRLLLAGVEAARSGRKITAAERKAISFMLGYKVAGPAVVGSVGASETLALAPTAPAVRPPYNDPAPQFWREIVGYKDKMWGCIEDDAVSLYVKEGKEWVHRATHHGVPMAGCCPIWYMDFWGVSLAGDPKKRATLEDLAMTNVFEALDAGQDEPGADQHPVVAALWRDMVAGIKAAEAGQEPSHNASLAFRVGYAMSKDTSAA